MSEEGVFTTAPTKPGLLKKFVGGGKELMLVALQRLRSSLSTN